MKISFFRVDLQFVSMMCEFADTGYAKGGLKPLRQGAVVFRKRARLRVRNFFVTLHSCWITAPCSQRGVQFHISYV